MEKSRIRFRTIHYRSATTSRFLQFFDLLAAKAGQFHWVLHFQQTVKRSSHDIVRVGGTKNLGTAIVNSNSLHYRADCTAGDYACSLFGGFQKHTTRAKHTNQFVRQGLMDQWHPDQVLFGGFDSLLDCKRHFSRFAGPETHVTRFIADYDQRGEREVLTALYHFCNAVNRDYLIFKIEALS